jgi:guanylate kinase
MSGQLYVITGPSGVGKSTIIRRLKKKLPGVGYSVSHTSRKPRKNEADGVNYHFVDRETFEEMIEEKAFVEWAEVYQDLYGTSFSSLRGQTDRGLDVVMDLDSQGAKNIKKSFEDSISIYILPPSLQELERRLRGRAADDEAEIKARLEKARKEIENCVEYDHIIFNENLNKTLEEVTSIILSERSRRSRRLPQVEKTFKISFSS